MKSKIEKLIIKLEKDKHENELKEHQCELDANFPQEMIHGSRISCLSMVIKELKKILNDSSAPIRTEGSCFCGKPAIVYAFDTYFCQHHNDELAKSFEARMKMPDNDFDGGGGA